MGPKAWAEMGRIRAPDNVSEKKSCVVRNTSTLPNAVPFGEVKLVAADQQPSVGKS